MEGAGSRFLRRTVLGIVPVIISAIAIGSYWNARGEGYTAVDVSVVLARLQQPGIERVTIEDREQVLKLDLAEPMDVEGEQTRQIQAQYPAEVSQLLRDQIRHAQQEGRVSESVRTTVNRGSSVRQSLLLMLSPVAMIVVLIL